MVPQRSITLARKTAETDIRLTLNVDGTGVAKIDTGVPFFDHMLTLFARHGLFDLDVTCRGDVDVDYHHTVEDVGLVLGDAFKQALGDKRGIRRYGFFYVPMDEALARVVVDLSGRACLVYDASAPTMFVRDFNLVLVKEFCRALSNALAANVHVKLEYGEEPHHVAEAIFKALARALDVATQHDPRQAGLIPSTKGSPVSGAVAGIAVIDTGICNLRSVTKAIETVGGAVRVVQTPGELQSANPAGLILPGVGALRDCVASLRTSGLDDSVRGWIRDGRPFLGVCLGMQALFEESEEGNVRGLAVFPGKVVRFRRSADFKIPHMGWNTVRFLQPSAPIARNLAPTGEAFYFVHSYHCMPEQRDLVLAECDYGGPFCAAIGRGMVAATQFHPEKSQRKGLQIYRNFVESTGSMAPKA